MRFVERKSPGTNFTGSSSVVPARTSITVLPALSTSLVGVEAAAASRACKGRAGSRQRALKGQVKSA